jgi:hypothetical protein
VNVVIYVEPSSVKRQYVHKSGWVARKAGWRRGLTDPVKKDRALADARALLHGEGGVGTIREMDRQGKIVREHHYGQQGGVQV